VGHLYDQRIGDALGDQVQRLRHSINASFRLRRRGLGRAVGQGDVLRLAFALGYYLPIANALFHTIVRFAGVFARSPLDQAVMRRVQPLDSVTRWEMPEHDASIALLKDRHREIMSAAWGGRSSSEAKTMNAFEHITRSLEAIEAPAAVVGLSRRAIDDERRHIEIGRRVASAYERESLPSPPLRKVRPPMYRQASRRLQALLRVISHCCLNETTACAYAQYSLSIARAPLVRAALREILADEIDHGRVGWAALAAAPPRLGADAAKWLPRLIKTHLTGWHASLVEWPAPLHAHGMPSKRAARRLVDRTMRDVILPGFAAYGIRIRR